MALLRSIQKDTGGFTEFVPLSLIHSEAPMYSKKLVPGVRPGATGVEVVLMHALARLMLGPTFRNIQASWVKEGPKLAAAAARRRAPTTSGARSSTSPSPPRRAPSYGQLVPPAELKRLIRDAGRVPAQRDTLYGIVRRFDEGDDVASPLDAVEDAEARFGSYRRLDRVGRVPLHARGSRRAAAVVLIRPRPTPIQPTGGRPVAKMMTKSATLGHLAQKIRPHQEAGRRGLRRDF